ncbi:MAG: sugar transferase [Bacteroidota bacterium]|jgi:lipopolysaccharide/colanic/teichoic acid biosynthesis glycosyltransferase
MIRFFDIVFSLFGLIICFPLFIIIALCITLDSKGGVFYTQTRVGKGNKDFRLLKFRSMRTDSDKKIGLTIGSRDSRITGVGYYLRRLKLDELPQLINVLKGEMSLVGPRPEIRKYVDLYSDEQRRVLKVKPGITDYASLEYINENEILGKSSHPEKDYIESIMPAKIALNMKFINDPSLSNYFRVLLLTFRKIF